MASSYGNPPSTGTLGASRVFNVNTTSELSSGVFNNDVLLSGSGSYTVTLPFLSTGTSGSKIYFINDSSTGTPTIAAQGSDSIRVLGVSQATITLNPGDALIIEHNGAAYSMATADPIKAGTGNVALTGVPTAPTAAVNTNTTQIATTAFVLGQASGAAPAALGTAQAGLATTYARGDHVHPSSAVTQAQGDSSTNIATTAFVDRLRSLQPSTSSGTLVLSDRGALVQITAGMTIPANIFSANDVVTLFNNTTGNLTLTQGTSLTLYWAGTASTGNRTLAQRGVCTVTFLSSTTAVISGAGIS